MKNRASLETFDTIYSQAGSGLLFWATLYMYGFYTPYTRVVIKGARLFHYYHRWPDGQHDEVKGGKAHLEIWKRSKANAAQYSQLQQLKTGE